MSDLLVERFSTVNDSCMTIIIIIILTCNKISFLFLLFYLCSFLPFLAVFTRGTLQRMSKSRHLIGMFNVKTSLDIAH